MRTQVFSMMKTLIVYGTRYGATAGTSEGIAKVLREEGFDVKVVNAKEEKIKDISEFEFVIVVSSAMKSVYEREGKTEDLEKTRKMYLEDKAAKYGLKPIAVGLFGGIVDYNKMGLIARKAFGSVKTRFEAAGFKETKPGVYDTRDWNEINDWARKLVLKARYL